MPDLITVDYWVYRTDRYRRELIAPSAPFRVDSETTWRAATETEVTSRVKGIREPSAGVQGACIPAGHGAPRGEVDAADTKVPGGQIKRGRAKLVRKDRDAAVYRVYYRGHRLRVVYNERMGIKTILGEGMT
jgi:hypothetical protein